MNIYLICMLISMLLYIVLGFVISRRVKNANDFFVARRRHCSSSVLWLHRIALRVCSWAMWVKHMGDSILRLWWLQWCLSAVIFLVAFSSENIYGEVRPWRFRNFWGNDFTHVRYGFWLPWRLLSRWPFIFFRSCRESGRSWVMWPVQTIIFAFSLPW